MAQIARGVSGASTDLVERVLDEYGDPGGSGETAPESTGDSTAGSSATNADADDGPGANGATGNSVAGAPVDEAAADGDPGEPMTETDTETTSDPLELDERDREILRAVAERPNATQEEIAGVLGVSRATISRRVNDIEGFEWQDRAAFVEAAFDDGTAVPGPDERATDGEAPGNDSSAAPGADGEGSADEGPTGDETGEGTSVEGDSRSGGTSVRAAAVETEAAAVGPTDESPASNGEEPGGASSADGRATDDQASDRSSRAGLADRVATVERRVDELESSAAADGSAFDDPELVHKVVHACIESDRIDEDEELRILAAVL